MSRIIHPNLVRAYTVIIFNNKAYIIMPLLSYGDLSSIISFKYSKGIHDEIAIATILKYCLEAIVCLNDNNWFHRDIKCSNILLDKDGSCLLGDYGVSSIIKEGGNNTFVGSLSWMAPEIALKREYSYKIDIWSLGITTIEMGNGKAPYKEYSPMEFLAEMESNRIPKLNENEKFKWSDDIKNFLKDCLIKNPQLRPDAKELLKKHKNFFDKAKNKEYLVETVLKGCPDLHKTFPNLLKECDQFFVKEQKEIIKDEKSQKIKEEIKEIISKKESNDVGEEMNVDEHTESGNEKKDKGFLESLQRKLDKNVNDLKGIVSDQNEEEC